MLSTKSTVLNLTYLIGFLGLKYIGKDTKIMITREAETSKSQESVLQRFTVIYFKFKFLSGNTGMTSWFPQFLESAHSKTPKGKISCFLPEVHISIKIQYITYPLLRCYIHVIVQ